MFPNQLSRHLTWSIINRSYTESGRYTVVRDVVDDYLMLVYMDGVYPVFRAKHYRKANNQKGLAISIQLPPTECIASARATINSIFARLREPWRIGRNGGKNYLYYIVKERTAMEDGVLQIVETLPDRGWIVIPDAVEPNPSLQVKTRAHQVEKQYEENT